ncbi:MAG: ATP-grasp fold amidoligase family protein [Tissierella sp.]|uniref:ATP-grasp fold amidoligase family protein n=1 Tax=Tissierella sp. TaxID=41274 RepID=UPI003F9D0B44
MNNTKLRKIKNIIKNNDELAFRLKALSIQVSDILSKIIPDESYIKWQYKSRTGRKLNLDSPQLYNEKIQWLKLNYRKSILNKCVDKYEVREYVKSKIDNAEEILIPVIGVYNTIEEVDFDSLPNSFILKLTNGSSFNYICFDKNKTEINKIRNRFRKWINLKYYSIGREWAYKDVKNRIICEELLVTKNGNPPEDYRFFCFNGEVKLISVDLESVVDGVKNSNYYRNLYDKNWQLIDGIIEYPNRLDETIEKPSKLQEMVEIAEKLSSDFPAVRVDFYYFDDKFYFGELTFYHASGYQSIQPYDLEKKMGDWIKIDKFI